VPYSTLAILKWAEWQKSVSLGEVNQNGSHGLAYVLTRDGINDCCDIAALGRLLAQVAACSRWVGKGASIEVLATGAIAPAIPDDVSKAVDWYENRRPTQALLADEGVFAEDGGLDDTEFINRPFFEFGEPSAGNDHLVLMSISNSPRFAAI
jgi:hypothetical protein